MESGISSRVANIAVRYITDNCDESPEKIFAAFEMLDAGTLKEVLNFTEDQQITTNGVPSAKIDDVSVDLLKVVCSEGIVSYKQLGEETASKYRNDFANEKYGELRTKTLIGTGVVNYVGGVIPTTLGKFISNLSKDTQIEILTMLCLRIPVIQNTIRASIKEPVRIFDLMPDFTKKTFIRRIPSVRFLITEICKTSDSIDLLKKIDFNYYGKED